MSSLATLAIQLQQTAQHKQDLLAQNRELADAVSAGTIATLKLTIQESTNVQSSNFRVWIEPAEACRGIASMDSQEKQPVMFELRSLEGQINVASLVDEQPQDAASILVSELPIGQVLMAYLKPESIADQEPTTIPRYEIRAELDSVADKQESISRAIAETNESLESLEAQVRQANSTNTSAAATSGSAEVGDDDTYVVQKPSTTKSTKRKQRAAREQLRRDSDEDDSGPSTLTKAWGYAQFAAAMMFEHRAVFIFVGSAVMMHLYGDYASV